MKTVLIFPTNFLDFWFDTVEKQKIINLSINSSQCYSSVVFSDTKVPCFREVKDETFFHFLILFCLEIALHKQESILTNLHVFQNSGGIYPCLQPFQRLIFFGTTSSASLVNFPTLMYTCQYFWEVVSDFWGVSSRFLKCFFLLWSLSSWLTAFRFALEVISSDH